MPLLQICNAHCVDFIFQFAGKLQTGESKRVPEAKFQIGGGVDSEESGNESDSSESNDRDQVDHVTPPGGGGEKGDENRGGIITGTTDEEVAYMREKLRKIGRESRHNVISRKDNLILIPDRAPGRDIAIRFFYSKKFFNSPFLFVL